jgi:hypothetical protein
MTTIKVVNTAGEGRNGLVNKLLTAFIQNKVAVRPGVAVLLLGDDAKNYLASKKEAKKYDK